VGAACLVEPGSAAWHAAMLGQVGPAIRVAVVGAGAIGLLAAAAAQAMGAAEVSVDARHPHQLSAREQIGATAPSGLYDVVIEAGGNEGALHRAIELARPRGTVVYVSAFYDQTDLPHAALALKEVALRPSQGYGTADGRRDFTGVAEMLAARPELPELLLITHRFPLEDAAAAFATAADRSQGVFRVVVEP
jgi:threonine dehydrogenase-like Zn-dependent dehydrogenase